MENWLIIVLKDYSNEVYKSSSDILKIIRHRSLVTMDTIYSYDLIKQWKSLSKRFCGKSYYIIDMEKDKCIISGACDPDDIDVLLQYIKDTDGLYDFTKKWVNLYCTVSGDAASDREFLYKEFDKHCCLGDMPVFGVDKFSQILNIMNPSIKSTKDTLTGIRLKTEDDDKNVEDDDDDWP